MHNDRMKEIGRWAIPPVGTAERKLLEKVLSAYKNNPEAEQLAKKTYKEEVASCTIQADNGAGLPADKLIREYNTEYNNRSFNNSLHDLPASFNVVEAFNTFLPPSATFKINDEIDSIFSFGDFLNFVTSDQSPKDVSAAHEAMEEGVIYSFNSIDDPSDFLLFHVPSEF